jgi:hypothetical protein
MNAESPRGGVVLTPQQLRNRRMRNIAIGVSVGAMAALFYAITIVRLAGHIFPASP